MKNKPGRATFSDFKSYQNATEINTNGQVFWPLVNWKPKPTAHFGSLDLYKSTRIAQREINAPFSKLWLAN